MVRTHIQGPVLVVRVLQAECMLLELLPLVGQGVLRLVELEALPRESTAALDALPFLAVWEGRRERLKFGALATSQDTMASFLLAENIVHGHEDKCLIHMKMYCFIYPPGTTMTGT